MNYLSIEEILQLHYHIIEDYGGAHGVREERRLLSVIEAPRQEVFGVEQYPTVHEKAAVYMRNIVADHPFFDGNKRTAITVGTIFLAYNDISLTATPKQLEDFAVEIATDHLDIPLIAAWLKEHTKKS